MNIYPFAAEVFPQYFPSSSSTDLPAGHGETVLLVDDEELVRNSVARSLGHFNYTVLAVGSGIEAIETFRQRLTDIKLVITDIVMPDMNGAALLHVLRILEPAVKAITISGYAPSSPVIDLLHEDQQHFLAKPFTTSELLCMVRATLDETARRFQIVDDVHVSPRRRRQHKQHA